MYIYYIICVCIQAYRDGTIAGAGAAVSEQTRRGLIDHSQKPSYIRTFTERCQCEREIENCGRSSGQLHLHTGLHTLHTCLHSSGTAKVLYLPAKEIKDKSKIKYNVLLLKAVSL
jgi:hypothetical protein